MKKITILFLISIFVLSACSLNEINLKPVDDDLTEYIDELLGVSFKYPNQLNVTRNLQNQKRIIEIKDKNNEFEVNIQIDAEHQDWWDKEGRDNYGMIETAYFGEIISKEIIKIAGNEASKIVIHHTYEPQLMSSEEIPLDEKIIEHNIAINHENHDELVRIDFSIKESSYDKYINWFDNIISSFSFLPSKKDITAVEIKLKEILKSLDNYHYRPDRKTRLIHKNHLYVIRIFGQKGYSNT
jgi:hypothetical protein